MQIKRFLILLFLTTNAVLLISADNPPPKTVSLDLQSELSEAFFQRLQESSGNKPLTFDLFTPELDTAFTSPDGKTAVLWLALRDDRGHLLATEPGLALATLSEGTWQVSLPGDPGWEEMLSNLPAGMLPLEQSPEPVNVVSSPITIKNASVRLLPAICRRYFTLVGRINQSLSNHSRIGIPFMFDYRLPLRV